MTSRICYQNHEKRYKLNSKEIRQPKMRKNLWRHSSWRKSLKRSTIFNRALIMLEGQSSRSLRRTSQYASYWSSWSEIWTSYRLKIRDQCIMSGWRDGHNDKQISRQALWPIIKKAKALISLNKCWHNSKFRSSLRTPWHLGMVTMIQTFHSSAKSKKSSSFRKTLFTKRYLTCLLSWNRVKTMHRFRCLTGKTL